MLITGNGYGEKRGKGINQARTTQVSRKIKGFNKSHKRRGREGGGCGEDKLVEWARGACRLKLL